MIGSINMMNHNSCLKKRPPKEVMCKLVDDHVYQKKGRFSKVCKNCGKEVIDEDAINALIQAMELRINQLEVELKSRIGVSPQPVPYYPYTTTTDPSITGSGTWSSNSTTAYSNSTTAGSITPLTQKEKDKALKDFYETYNSLKAKT